MKKDVAIKTRKACAALIRRLTPYVGKNTRRLGEKAMADIREAVARAKEIGGNVPQVVGADGKTICLDDALRTQDMAEKYIHAWDTLEAGDELAAYQAALVALRDAEKALASCGVTTAMLSNMGLRHIL